MKTITLILIAALIGIFSCEQGERLNTDVALKERIKGEVISGQGKLSLGKLTDFEWDSLLILTPYVNPGRVEEQFGIDLSRTKHSGIESRDDINQLIFFNNGKPVNMVEYPRYPGDFSKNKVQFIKRDSAVFNVIVTKQKTVGGDDWIELKLQSKQKVNNEVHSLSLYIKS